LDYVTFLRHLIAFPTINDPTKNIRPTRDCPAYLKEKLMEIGCNTRILEKNGFFSVLGTYGKGHPVTLLLAHFDVVPIGPGWKSDPFELTIRTGKGFGRGTADDKGNITALLLTAEELVQHEMEGTMVFAMTGDEEIGGTNGAPVVRAKLEQQNLFPDYLITADGVGMQIVTRRRNTISVTLSVSKLPKRCKGFLEKHQFTTDYVGRQSRHSAYFLPGIDRHALLAASNFLLQNPHIQVCSTKGSFVKSNVVPDWFEFEGISPKGTSDQVTCTCDRNLTKLLQVLLPITRIQFAAHPSDYGITFCPNLLYERNHRWEIYFDGRAMTTDVHVVEQALNAVLAEKLQGIEYQAAVRMGKAFMNTPVDSRLVQIAQNVAKELSQNPDPIELGGASDTRHYTDRLIQAIDFGPIGFGVHGSNEHVVLDTIPQTAKFYAQLVRALHQPTGA
jgi:succinyl-diaminopimelate desuccinylase